MRAPLERVSSISELQTKAAESKEYEQLTITAARNLGCSSASYPEAINWIILTAQETGDEDGVVEEVNFCLDLIS